jgi:hypothetical protein
VRVFVIALVVLLPVAAVPAQHHEDQFIQIFYRTGLNGGIENDEEGLQNLRSYMRYQSRGLDLCRSMNCIISIYHIIQHGGLDGRKNAKFQDQMRIIEDSKLFDIFVSDELYTSEKNEYIKTRMLKPGEHRRLKSEKLHLLFYALPDCSHESPALVNQVYRFQSDADLFVVFLPESGKCVDFLSPQNPYHSLYDPPEKETSRTLFLSTAERFRFYRDRRGSYRCSAPHLARIRLHFRGRKLLGVEAFEEQFLESERNYPL